MPGNPLRWRCSLLRCSVQSHTILARDDLIKVLLLEQLNFSLATLSPHPARD